MNTDKIPRKAELKAEYKKSELLREIILPPALPLIDLGGKLAVSLKEENKKEVQKIANEISAIVADTYYIDPAPVKILGVRPRKVTESSSYELFGDYDTETSQIRLWMRTAVLKKPTSYGTFLSTLCHELCHHLDLAQLELPNSYHTRGFYDRIAKLYHHIADTPYRQLVWTELNDGSFMVNWPATMKGSKQRK